MQVFLETGKQIAADWCSECHRIAPDQPSGMRRGHVLPPPVEAPSFMQIAEKPMSIRLICRVCHRAAPADADPSSLWPRSSRMSSRRPATRPAPSRRKRFESGKTCFSVPIDRTAISLVIDLGCGTGRFSELLAAHHGVQVAALTGGVALHQHWCSEERRGTIPSVGASKRTPAKENFSVV
jgi:hypothetical protein